MHFVKPRTTLKQTASPNVLIDRLRLCSPIPSTIKQDDWDTKLDKLSYAYNTAVHSVKKISPFELTFGRIPKLPIDLVYDQPNSEELMAKIDLE